MLIYERLIAIVFEFQVEIKRTQKKNCFKQNVKN